MQYYKNNTKGVNGNEQCRERNKNGLSEEMGDSMAEVKIGMTIEEASEYTGIGRNTMRKLVEWGKIPVLRIGRKAIIRRDVLERFMAANEGRNLRNEHDVKTVKN